jgi:hypothetical protein
LLQQYQQANSYLDSVSMKMKVQVGSFDLKGNTKEDKTEYTMNYDFRRNRKKECVEWLGRQSFYDSNGEFDLAQSRTVKHISNGRIHISLNGAGFTGGLDSRFVGLTRNYNKRQKELLQDSNFGGALFGMASGNDFQDVHDLLSNADDLSLQPEKDSINGISCMILEGTSRYGKVRVWISPEKNYSAVKWIETKNSEDLYDGMELSIKWPSVKSSHRQFVVSEFQEVMGTNGKTYVPRKASFTYTTVFTKGYRNVDEYEYIIDNVDITPDFVHLGAFKIDLPDGIRVLNHDFPSVKHKWFNGKPVLDVDL